MSRFAACAAVVSWVAATSIASACNVPVFRYALERWPADLYELVVLHDGPLSAEDEAVLGRLRENDRGSIVSANFRVRAAEIGEVKDPMLKRLWSQRDASSAPLLVTLYPRDAREVPDRLVAALPLTKENVDRLVDSPARQKVVKRILSGDSAVWLFLPSGDPEQDQQALRTLRSQVSLNQKDLELPPQDEIEADEYFQAENPIELRLGFSVVEVDREDPSEQFLIQMLLGSEPDLEQLEQPMAFPVIGRGRALYALVGKGIFSETIGMASRFVVGPCSCQVKDQNPGFDLLLAVDWEEKLGGAAVNEPTRPAQKKPILIEIPPGK